MLNKINNLKFILLLVYFLMENVIGDNAIKVNKPSVVGLSNGCDVLPKDNLEEEKGRPTPDDLNTYLLALYRMANNLMMEPNDTDPNKAIGSYFARGTMMRTFLDYGDKLNKDQTDYLKFVTKCFDSYLSHFVYMCKWKQRYYGVPHNDIGVSLSKMFATDTTLLAYWLPEFSRGQLKPWLSSSTTTTMNNFTHTMDAASLTREEYTYELLESTQNTRYHIYVNESDRCLIHLAHSPPSAPGPAPAPARARARAADDTTLPLPPCRYDAQCRNALYKSPSIAYSLSHRQLQYLVSLGVWRCYVQSPAADEKQLHLLCAAMYREARYIARKGFFARDMFAEHAALCSMVGYEEFYHRSWLLKVSGWVDGEGCVREDRNFIRRRYSYDRARALRHQRDRRDRRDRRDQHDDKYLHKLKYWYRKSLVRPCNDHLLAVTVAYLASGVRHAAHHVAKRKVA